MPRCPLMLPDLLRLAVLGLLGFSTTGTVRADESLVAASPADRGLGARLGMAAGSATTPGGARIEGLYLYKLAEQDWFDGRGSLTVGGGGAHCFRNRDNELTCDHGAFDGAGGTVSGSVRRYLGEQGAFSPYARIGAGLAVLRFGGDELTGLGVPVIVGAGVMATISDLIRVGGEATVEVGPSFLGRGLGTALYRQFVVGAAVEFHLN